MDLSKMPGFSIRYLGENSFRQGVLFIIPKNNLNIWELSQKVEDAGASIVESTSHGIIARFPAKPEDTPNELVERLTVCLLMKFAGL